MNYSYKLLKTSEMTEKDIVDFIFVQTEVFTKSPITAEIFRHKYIDDIYGDSIFVIAYDEDNKPAAARALWRNDLGDIMAYQPCDTATLKEHRRRGLFASMTELAVSSITDKAVIYNFPNDNSYPQYKKLGWKDYAIQYTRLFTPLRFNQENDLVIPDDYFEWWLKPSLSADYACCRLFGKFYLVKKMAWYSRYMVYGELNPSSAEQLKKVSPLVLTYNSCYKSFYNKGNKIACKIVSFNNKNIKIPNWKTDVL